MDWAFEKWDPVLMRIMESHPSLAMYLSEELVHSLVFDRANDSSESARGEALYLWLAHIFTSPRWKPRRAFCPRSYILTACRENSNHWSRLLAEQLREHKDLTSAVHEAQSDVQSCLPTQDGAQKSSIESASVAEKLREHGWGPVEKWDCRPLGITSTS